METITIPSPSAFLDSPILKPAPEPPPPPPPLPPPPKRKPPAPVSRPENTTTTKGSGVVKPKQSKSRNGCITCKAKRLKCDETKPSCQQCYKRSVTCGGYKKDFKWRPFQETAIAHKVIPPPKPKRNSVSLTRRPPDVAPVASPVSDASASSPLDAGELDEKGKDKGDGGGEGELEGETDIQMQESFFHAAASSPPSFSSSTAGLPDLGFAPMFDMSTPPYLRELPRPRFEPDTVTRSLNSLFDDTHTPPNSGPAGRPNFSGQSPRLIDLLMPGSELNARPGTGSMPPISMPTPAMTLSPMMDNQFIPHMEMQHDQMEDDIEEVTREPQMSDSDLWLSLRQPAQASRPPLVSNSFNRDDQFNKLYRQPQVQAGSPEMLMLRYDKQTCGILSIKDGPTENPWRTLVWPLARDSPALYHAIASMTAFHTSKEKPALRVEGMEHMRRSIRSLATGIEKMRTDTALATTLVLAFSESWDQHISTGIEHLRGAKILVNQALISHKKRALTGDDLARLKFLCNTWVYMDVIARLTSLDESEMINDVSHKDALGPLIPPNLFSNDHTELDPLMGCASTLFPLIGKAASLCRRVTKFETNSIQIISQAIELKEAIERWDPAPGNSFERPEDPSAEIQHALQTAEAYRYATLLYLHQAVPEIPSLTSAQLAKKVLVYLATVPLSSRLVIVQIYPLLAAGCEAYEREDRQWVEERWQAMALRMLIGNIDRCWEVMQEVWSRRDAHEAAKAEKSRGKQRPGAGQGMIHNEISKRKFEEELALDEGWSFEDMLNSNIVGGLKRSRGNGNVGAGGGFSVPATPLLQKRRMEPVTEEMDPEVTVRGRLHWVGVMKDWEWEILLG